MVEETTEDLKLMMMMRIETDGVEAGGAQCLIEISDAMPKDMSWRASWASLTYIDDSGRRRWALGWTCPSPILLPTFFRHQVKQ